MKGRIFYLVLVVFFGMFVFAYTQDVFNPGHGGDKIYIVVNGNETSLQDAIDFGEFDSGYSGAGSYGGDIGDGHNADEVFVNINGDDKSLQEGINDGSLCLFGGGAASSYSGSGFLGHTGGEFLIDFGGEKSLQEAIDAGDFEQNAWSPSPADTACGDPVNQTRCGENRTVAGTKNCCVDTCSGYWKNIAYTGTMEVCLYSGHRFLCIPGSTYVMSDYYGGPSVHWDIQCNANNNPVCWVRNHPSGGWHNADNLLDGHCNSCS